MLRRDKDNVDAATKTARRSMVGDKILNLSDAKYSRLFQEKINNNLFKMEELRLKNNRAVNAHLTKYVENQGAYNE